MADDPAVAVESLSVIRGGAPVLRNLSLQIATATVTGLLGPSGSGKSTLLRSIVGVQRVAAGAISVFGEPAGSASLRPRVGYMTQSPSVYGDLSVRENLRYFARVLRVPPSRVDETIEAVALDPFATRVVGRLSGGQRARVSLASALLGLPDLLVLDEPTVGLDPVLRRDLWAHFERLAAAGVTLLISSHVMDEAARCDELVLMRDGRLLATQTPDALRQQTGCDDLGEAFLTLIEREAGA